RAWHRARAVAFSPSQLDSPLARRPYDLRHACLSTWLNAGVPPVQVAEWAGHTVAVLLHIYAKCVEGQQDAAKRRIEAALATDPGDQGAEPRAAELPHAFTTDTRQQRSTTDDSRTPPIP
ncbi:MAG TPA: hypothetical protein VFJ14_03745, partial [Nocardioidaceae bacterium]|nr:hypothetical protein [Nocardioidaceae bacterium]